MIFIITFHLIRAMLPLLNLIEIHDQIEGFFKSYAMAQSACQGLVFLRNDMLLKMRGSFFDNFGAVFIGDAVTIFSISQHSLYQFE